MRTVILQGPNDTYRNGYHVPFALVAPSHRPGSKAYDISGPVSLCNNAIMTYLMS